jgi:hypothetical protein
MPRSVHETTVRTALRKTDITGWILGIFSPLLFLSLSQEKKEEERKSPSKRQARHAIKLNTGMSRQK